jgi:ubiquitin carboxyl-terminal hydrolase 48
LILSTNSCILYILAHICDSTTSTWYKFNDEVVEKMEGKNLKLGTEEDVDGKS